LYVCMSAENSKMLVFVCLAALAALYLPLCVSQSVSQSVSDDQQL